jgi:mannose-6-phosphate isomerase-like protein (cupin superfamily)
MITKSSVKDQFARIEEPWRPQVGAELNGQEMKLVKCEGILPWYHELEDELFLAWRGSLTIEFRGHRVILQEGEYCVVPRGTEHRLMAYPQADVLVFESAATVHSGDFTDDVLVAPSGASA